MRILLLVAVLAGCAAAGFLVCCLMGAYLKRQSERYSRPVSDYPLSHMRREGEEW